MECVMCTCVCVPYLLVPLVPESICNMISRPPHILVRDTNGKRAYSHNFLQHFEFIPLLAVSP